MLLVNGSYVAGGDCRDGLGAGLRRAVAGGGTTTNPTVGKGRNLAADGRCSASTSTERVDFVVEGTAAPVTDPDHLERVFAAYRSKYGWPAAIVDGAFDAPFGAPTAGPPPYQPYAITPETVYGIGTDDELAPRSTRWRF